jgi:hypothetical protein
MKHELHSRSHRRPISFVDGGGKLKASRWIVFIAVLILAFTAVAQNDSGSIVGTVTDQTGAVIAGATIAVTNNATGVTVSVITNSEGQYQVLSLIPGTYSVKAKAKGMKPEDYPNVEIHVQSRPALNFQLTMEGVTESVTVAAEVPVLQTQSAELGGVVNSKTINDAPLNGRVYAQLALLEAGAGKYYSGPNETPDRFSINGNSEMQNYFALDGIDNNSASTNQQDNSMQVTQPPPDALEEFKVQTRTYSTEFGNAAGGVINVSTKSGTNAFHGDLWEFIRNDKLDANTFFNNRYGVKRGPFKQNQYGATLGGPIIKNRTFFFADFQGFNSRRAVTQTSTVPTPLMKQGNFTELPYNLATVVPAQAGCISGNIIQVGCIDGVAKNLLTLYPDPNIASAVALEGTPGSFSGGSNYQYQTNNPNNAYSAGIRIDHNINDRNKIFGRFGYASVSSIDPPWTANGLAGASNWSAANSVHGRSLSLSWTDALSSSLFNEVRFGFNRMFALKVPPGNVQMGKSAAPDFGLSGLPNTPYSVGLPPISINGVTGMGSSYWRPQDQVSQVYQLMEDLSWLKGRHSLKFGYQYYRLNSSFLDIMAPQGAMSATGIYTNNNGFGLPDFMLGDMSSARYTTPMVPHNFRPGHSFYAEDAWRITDKLTINYGLRYELFAPLMDHSNEISNFTAANGGGFISVAPQASGWKDRSLINPDRKDFAPRFGFAYQALKRMVIRGGYGIFYQHNYRFGSESVMSLNPPYVADAQLSQSQGSTTPVFILSEGFPVSSLGSATTPLYNLQVRAQDPNQRTSYVEQTSFGTEIQLTPSTVLSTDYVGNFGRKMARIRNANQGLITGFDGTGNPIVVFPYANLNQGSQHAFLEYETHDGNLNYNGLQASLRRQFSHGVSFGLSYTWSHNIADYNVPINGDFSAQNAYNMAAERSDSSLDVRHRLVGTATWVLPVGKGGVLLNNGGRASSLLGGWQVNAIVTFQTGNPFTINAPDNSGTGGNHGSRANCIGDPFAGASSDPHDYVGGGSGFFINPAAFGVPALGQFGTCAPFSVHGPGYENVDLSLFKSFHLSEAKRIEFRTEFFNAFNHANFGTPNSYIGDPNSFGKVYWTVGDPRQIQFALKLYF